jgi:hypothetical protein
MNRYRIDIKEVGKDWTPYSWADTHKDAMIAVRKAILWELYSSKFRITDTLNNTIIYDTTRPN